MDESSDTAQVEDQDFADGEFLLYVSRFEKRKNHLSLLNAFVTLLQDKPQLRLVLVGFDADGSQNDCKRFIVTHGIGANVEMLSNISDAHLNRLFRTATVVVYPSLCEGFGMPIIESLLLNPKTVYSNTTAMSDFSFAPENMFNPSDVNAIVQIIHKTMSISANNTTAWVAQREYIANKYNWTRSAQVLLAMHEPQMFAPSLAQRSAK
jgi:glycosyltransferase involved in cell wall biosynthesis